MKKALLLIIFVGLLISCTTNSSDLKKAEGDNFYNKAVNLTNQGIKDYSDLINLSNFSLCLRKTSVIREKILTSNSNIYKASLLFDEVYGTNQINEKKRSLEVIFDLNNNLLNATNEIEGYCIFYFDYLKNPSEEILKKADLQLERANKNIEQVDELLKEYTDLQ